MLKSILLLTLCFLISCTKTENVSDNDTDKIVRIQIYSTSWSTTDTIPPKLIYISIPRFDISEYSGITKATFYAYLLNSSSTQGNTVHADLYNMTDSIPIPNSEIMTNTAGAFVESNNFLNSLPKKKIDIAIRLWNSIPNAGNTIYPHTLFLYR